MPRNIAGDDLEEERMEREFIEGVKAPGEEYRDDPNEIA